MNMEFSAYIDYSSNCFASDYVFATPLPERLPPLYNVMYPFQNSLWLILGVTVAALTVAFATIGYLAQVSL